MVGVLNAAHDIDCGVAFHMTPAVAFRFGIACDDVFVLALTDTIRIFGADHHSFTAASVGKLCSVWFASVAAYKRLLSKDKSGHRLQVSGNEKPFALTFESLSLAT